MIAVLVDENVRDQRLGRQAAGHHVRCGRRLVHAIGAEAAGIARSDRHHDAVLCRDDVEPFRTVLADLVQRASTGALQAVGLDHHLEARQMCRQRSTLRASRPALARHEAITLGFLVRLVLQALGFAKGNGLVFQRQCELIGGKLLRTLTEGRAVDQLEDILEPRRAGALGQQHRLELLDVVGKLIVSGLYAGRCGEFRMRRHARILADFSPPGTALRQAESGMRPTAHEAVWALAERARATSPTLRSGPRLAPPTASLRRLRDAATGTFHRADASSQARARCRPRPGALSGPPCAPGR